MDAGRWSDPQVMIHTKWNNSVVQPHCYAKLHTSSHQCFAGSFKPVKICQNLFLILRINGLVFQNLRAWWFPLKKAMKQPDLPKLIITPKLEGHELTLFTLSKGAVSYEWLSTIHSPHILGFSRIIMVSPSGRWFPGIVIQDSMGISSLIWDLCIFEGIEDPRKKTVKLGCTYMIIYVILSLFQDQKVEIFPNIDPAWVTKCQFNELTEI